MPHACCSTQHCVLLLAAIASVTLLGHSAPNTSRPLLPSRQRRCTSKGFPNAPLTFCRTPCHQSLTLKASDPSLNGSSEKERRSRKSQLNGTTEHRFLRYMVRARKLMVMSASKQTWSHCFNIERLSCTSKDETFHLLVTKKVADLEIMAFPLGGNRNLLPIRMKCLTKGPSSPIRKDSNTSAASSRLGTSVAEELSLTNGRWHWREVLIY